MVKTVVKTNTMAVAARIIDRDMLLSSRRYADVPAEAAHADLLVAFDAPKLLDDHLPTLFTDEAVKRVRGLPIGVGNHIADVHQHVAGHIHHVLDHRLNHCVRNLGCGDTLAPVLPHED